MVSVNKFIFGLLVLMIVGASTIGGPVSASVIRTDMIAGPSISSPGTTGWHRHWHRRHHHQHGGIVIHL